MTRFNLARFNLARGFTLVELLVVITIMAVLINLTLPSLKNAWDAAQVTRCLSNQRQISMSAAGIYAAEFKGVIVPCVGWGPAGRVNPYMAMGLGSDYLYPSVGWSISMWELLNPGSYTPAAAAAATMIPVGYCPADKPWWRGQNGDWRETTYGLNVYLSYNKGGKPIHTRCESLGKLSEKALMIESHHRGTHGVRSGSSQVYPGTDYLLTPMFPSEYYIAGDRKLNSSPRHYQGFTTSYVDGHAQFIKHPEVFNIDVYPDNSAGVQFSAWFNYPLQTGGFYNAAFNGTWAPYPQPWLP